MKRVLETIDDAELIAISEDFWDGNVISMTINGLNVTETSVLREITRRFEERVNETAKQ